MKSTQWRTNPTRFLAMTGYTIEQFDALLPFFEEAHDDYLQRFYLGGKPREGYRRFVLYQNSPLPTHAERLIFVLTSLKLNSIQEDLAERFELQQKQVCVFVHGLKPILEAALRLALAMPAQTQAALKERLLEQQGPLVVMHDASERPIPRPVDRDDQQAAYSGKKKQHTVKNAFIINTLNMILFVGVSVMGSVHDKKLADTQYDLSGVDELWQDTGYQG